MSAPRLIAGVGPTNAESENDRSGVRMQMSSEELEAAALKLDPKSRARLASRLLESLDDLSAAENARLWADEAQRRLHALEAGSLASRSADDVCRDAQARI